MSHLAAFLPDHGGAASGVGDPLFRAVGYLSYRRTVVLFPHLVGKDLAAGDVHYRAPMTDVAIPKRAPRKGPTRLRLTVVIIVLVLLAFEAYARFPARDPVPLLIVPRDTEELVLVLHGTGGKDEPTLIALTKRLRELSPVRPRRVVTRYLWAPMSDNIFRAASNGQHVGVELGRQLARLAQLRSVRLIAHSAGSYLLDPLCESYRQMAPHGARVEMTFLDPIGTMGTWDYGYGYRNHGRCADFASAYINLDDPVPGTNAPLEHGFNVDVTRAASRRGFRGEGHVWPIQYYLDHLTVEQALPGLRNHQAMPRGRVERAP